MRKKITAALVALVAACGLVVTGAVPASASTASKQVGYTSVVLAPEVYSLVASAGITPSVSGGAVASPYKDTLQVTFPITGYALRNLAIKHRGAVSLTAGSASITLSSFTIDLARLRVSGEVSGTVGNVGRVDLFRIALPDRFGYGAVRLKLTDAAAGALNTTFGVDAFQGGATFGYATPRPLARL